MSLFLLKAPAGVRYGMDKDSISTLLARLNKVCTSI